MPSFLRGIETVGIDDGIRKNGFRLWGNRGNRHHLTGHAVDLWLPDPATDKPLPSDAAFKPGKVEAKAAGARLWATCARLRK